MRLDIRKKILLLQLVPLFMGIILITIIAYAVTQKYMESTIQHQLDEAVKPYSKMIDHYLEARMAELAVISQADVLEQQNRERIEKYLEESLLGSSYIDQLVFFDTSGKVINFATADSIGHSVLHGDDHEQFFKLARSASPGQVFLQPAFYDEVHNRMRVDLLTPVTDDENLRVIGVLRSSIDGGKMGQMMKDLAAGMSGKMTNYILQDGKIIFSSEESTTLFVPFGASGRPVNSFTSQADIKAHGQAESKSWQLVSTFDRTSIMLLPRLLRNYILGFGSLLGVMGLFISYFVSTAFSSPLQRLYQSIKKVTDGNYDAKISLNRNDEFGDLAASFNQLITKLGESQGKLKRSEEQHRKMIELSPQAHLLSKDGKILYCNQAAAEFYGIKEKEQLIGLNTTELVRPEFQETIRERQRLIREEQRDLPLIPFTVLRKDGTEIHLEGISFPMEMNDEIYAYTIIHNVEERFQLTRKLGQSEEKFSKAFSASPIAVMLIDRETEQILEVNPAFNKMTGYTEEEARTQTLSGLQLLEEGGEFVRMSIAKSQERSIRTREGNTAFVLCSPEIIELNERKVVLLMMTDITLRKQAEAELVRSKQFAENLIQAMSDGFSILDNNGVHLDVNDSFCKMTGYSREELIGVGVPHPYWPENEYEKINEAFETSLAGDFQEIELNFRTKDGRIFPVLISPSQIVDEEGQIIAHFATVKDISEQKRNEEELKASNARFELVAQATNEAIWDWDMVNDVTWANQNLYDFYGLDASKDKLVADTFFSRVHSEDVDKVKQTIADAIKKGEGSMLKTYRIRNKDGIYRTVLDRAKLLYDDSGRPVRVLGAMLDVTERIESEERERLRTQVLEMVSKGAPLTTVLNTLVTGAERYAPEVFCSVLLLDKEGRRLSMSAAPSLPAFYNEAVQRVEIGPGMGSCGTCVHTGERVIIEDIQTHAYWKEWKHLAAQAGLASCWSEPIIGASGKVLGCFTMYHKIPERPQKKDLEFSRQLAELTAIVLDHHYAAAALKESESRLKTIFDTEPQCVKLVTEDGKLLHMNRAGLEMVEAENLEQVKGQPIMEVVDEKYRSGFMTLVRESFQGKSGTLVFTITGLKGTPRWLETHSAPLRDETGKIIASLGVTQDITERKKGEEERSRLSSILESTSDFVGMADLQRNVLYINKSGRKMIGIGQDEDLSHLKIDSFRPDWANRIIDTEGIPEAIRRGSWRGETALINGKGEEIPVNQVIVAHKNEAGEVMYLSTIIRDISESKKAEQAIRASEAEAKILFDYSAIVIWEEDFSQVKNEFEALSRSGITDFRAYLTDNPDEVRRLAHLVKVTQVNHKSLEFYGVECKEMLLQSMPGWFVEDTWPVFTEELIGLAEGKTKFESEIPILTPAGELKHFIISLSVPPQYQQTLEKVLVSFIDITERKRAESRLKQITNLLDTTQSIAKVGGWEANLNTQTLFWSQQTYQILDTSPEEYQPSFGSATKFLLPDTVPLIKAFMQQVETKSRSTSFKIEIITAKGRKKWVQVYCEYVKEEGKRGILRGAIQDITYKVEAEKEQLRALIMGEENERKRLAAELHDSLGQTLSLISLNLDSIIHLKNKNLPIAQQKLKASLGMVNQTIDEIRTISHNLMPRSLQDFGLKTVLANMLQRTQSATGISTEFSFENTADRYLSNVEINVYRIAQEALNNSIKHAQAKKITLNVKEIDQVLHLVYRDDGRGFDLQKINNQKIIHGLRNIENRVHVLGGNIRIQSAEDQGATLKVEIPIAQ